MSSSEMRKIIDLVESTSSHDEESRRARVQNAIDWLEQGGHQQIERGNPRAADPWFSRARTLKGFLEKNLEAAEDWIVNGDNFLDAGWEDPFK